MDLDAVPHDDAATYDMVRESRTIGCFQIESPGQRELVAKLEPRTMHDLIVDISLFRPGPVNSDMITPYLESRHGFRQAVYPHPALRAALAETNGVVVFHEQVLRIVDAMTGCGLSQAEKIRRSLSSPDGRARVRTWWEMNVRPEFDAATVEETWRVLDAFGAFGFCKAHAAAFGLPTYQSAWLKRHHTGRLLRRRPHPRTGHVPQPRHPRRSPPMRASRCSRWTSTAPPATGAWRNSAPAPVTRRCSAAGTASASPSPPSRASARPRSTA